MKFNGFIGPTYQLDSVNVDAQRCINLYPEIIESGNGKEGRVKYLRSTPGLELIKEVGDGPIRCVHVDSVGRTFVVSGNKLYTFTKNTLWELMVSVRSNTVYSGTINQALYVDHGSDAVLLPGANYTETSTKVRLTSTGTLPAPLAIDTDYWTIKVNFQTIKFASSLADAVAGTAIDLTNNGSPGFMTITSQANLVHDNILDINMTSAIDYGTGTITKASHGYYTGLKVRTSTTGIFPTGLAIDTDYWVIRVDSNSFKLASSIENASAGTAISLTASEEEWAAVRVPWRSNNNSGSTVYIDFDSSTGPVKASSMSLQGDGTDSATLFLAGGRNYVFRYIPDSDGLGRRYQFERNGDAGDVQSLVEGPSASHAVWVDGYFIINKVGTNQFFVSDLQDTTFGILSFSSSEGNPDILLALAANNRLLYAFNEQSTEIYSNTGAADFPFERIQGGLIEVGIAARYSVASVGTTVIWLGRTKQGEGHVYAMRGTQEQRISTHALEQTIAGYADISSATAYTYESKGHQFYVLNFDEGTWVFDLSTGLWHERAYTNEGQLERHLVENHAYLSSGRVHLVSDHSSNKIYALKDDVYSDNGNEITRLRRFPHISADLKTVFCHSIQIDMEAGVGLASGQGSDPQVMLRWSNDGGHTWSDESWTSAGGQVGGIGEYTKRVRWRRIGKFRDRVFEVKITDPVKVVFIGAHIELEVGSS